MGWRGDDCGGASGGGHSPERAYVKCTNAKPDGASKFAPEGQVTVECLPAGTGEEFKWGYLSDSCTYFCLASKLFL